MSNTTQRILSALVLILALSIIIYFGQTPFLYLLLAIGVLVSDEIMVNFFKYDRFGIFYFLAQIILVLPFIFFSFIDTKGPYLELFNNIGVVTNTLLLVYLFYFKMDSSFINKMSRGYPFLFPVFILLFPLLSIVFLLSFPIWKYLLVILFVTNFGMDTGAWFFGRRYGKNKLWERVSPNKTIEGLLGGMLTAGIAGSVLWYLLIGGFEIRNFFIFVILGLLSQLGDLVQSKLKRDFSIKDSSRLIPGHGGVYDRLDSLIFMVPFFLISLKLFK